MGLAGAHNRRYNLQLWSGAAQDVMLPSPFPHRPFNYSCSPMSLRAIRHRNGLGPLDEDKGGAADDGYAGRGRQSLL